MISFWPKPSYKLSLTSYPESEIENFFNELFAPYKCLLFSSGRSALISCLQAHQIKRGDLVWCEDYSSHCVQDAVAFVGNISSTINNSKLLLLNHSLGYETKVYNKLCIEDSVDSFFTGPTNCFPNENSLYEIVSLPKVIGSFTGGLVICRDQESYQQLHKAKLMRHQRSIIHNDITRFLKANSPRLENIWSSLEKSTSKCSLLGRNNIATLLDEFERNKKKRLANLSLCQKHLPHLTTNEKGRLPTAIPIALSDLSNDFLQEYPHLVRSYGKIKDDSIHYEKSFFLPVHHQISSHFLNKFFKAGLAKKS